MSLEALPSFSTKTERIQKTCADSMGEEMSKEQEIENIKTQICERYCRYPYEWDEEKDGELSESDVCRECPLNRL